MSIVNVSESLSALGRLQNFLSTVQAAVSKYGGKDNYFPAVVDPRYAKVLEELGVAIVDGYHRAQGWIQDVPVEQNATLINIARHLPKFRGMSAPAATLLRDIERDRPTEDDPSNLVVPISVLLHNRLIEDPKNFQDINDAFRAQGYRPVWARELLSLAVRAKLSPGSYYALDTCYKQEILVLYVSTEGVEVSAPHQSSLISHVLHDDQDSFFPVVRDLSCMPAPAAK